MYYEMQIREEELKNRVANDYFWLYDNTKIIGNIDFCVALQQADEAIYEQQSLIWAEAKKGKSDILKSFVQLILTLGKARTFDSHLPPPFLGAFDAEKIAFISYNDIQEFFYLNDFNWNVTPSDYESKEFDLLYNKVKSILNLNTLIYYFEKDDFELKQFIRNNLAEGKFGKIKTQIDKNNFIVIYNKWLQEVKPTISVNWELAEKKGVISGDFYLADLLSEDNITLKDKLFVVLNATQYILNRHKDEFGAFTSSTVEFKDKQTAHQRFWNKYERPPKEAYWDYIIERRDLLVPQDVRERKGSFFTPQKWVELSQEYLTNVLGEDWQEEFYIWDCAAGTGNLLNGLTNKYNIWASTLDKQDVEVMKDRINNGANLLESHVFQFDFLNDDFSKLPLPLQNILNDPDKRKKLVIYINPPYAESGSGVGRSFKINVALEHETHKKFKERLGKAANEVFIQFLTRIYFEIPDCRIAEFSKLKTLQSSNFKDFRNFFLAKLEKMFVVPADTFDNVKGQFPIGFKIWSCNKKILFKKIKADVFNKIGNFIENKTFYSYDKEKGKINDWLRKFFDKKNKPIGILHNNKNDFQHNVQVRITTIDIKDHTTPITVKNLTQMCIYLTVRHCIPATWLNDRDQFLYPNNKWKNDKEFQNDCLAFTLFHSQNRITSKDGTNHWIPFTEEEVNSKEKYESNFMSKFIKGKIKEKEIISSTMLLFEPKADYSAPLRFSPVAKSVFDAGRELWSYYHTKPDCNVNASLYDIREYFQGRNSSGRMNNNSNDEKYLELITALRNRLKFLAKKIEPKLYEYEFLKK